MMQRYDRILLDISNIYYRAFCVSQDIVSVIKGKRIVTGGVLKSIKMIQRIEKEYLTDDGRMYFLFDNAFSGEERRRDIDPEYKINRKKKEPQFYRGLDYLRLLLLNYKDGYRVVHKAEYEADDLVEPVLESFEGKGRTVLLVSNDMDWSRAISKNIHWLTRKDGEDVIFDETKFYSEFGFYPTRFRVCMYKALLGDALDNIKAGVQGISKKDVLSIIQQVQSIDDFFLSLYSLDIDNDLKEKIIKCKGKIKLNYILIDYHYISKAECRECTTISEFNKKMLIRLLRVLNFNPEAIDERLSENGKMKETEFFNDFDKYKICD